MSNKPTGVFVRLPFSGTERERILDEVEVDPDTVEESLLAIGAPVTDGGLEVYHAPIVITENGAERIPLVRQSDALAKLAEKDEEIARYREAMEDAREYARKGSWSRAHVALHKALKDPEA